MSFKALAVICLLFFGFTAPAAANEYDDYEKIRLNFVANNFSKVIPAATKLLKSENISQVNRANLLTFRGVSFNETGQHAKGLEDLTAAIALASKPYAGEMRYHRFFSYYNLGRKDEAYEDMLFVAQNSPKDVQDFEFDLIKEIIKYLKENKRTEDVFALRLALHKSEYRGLYPMVNLDGLYIDLARDLMKRKDYGEAEKVIAGFTEYSTLIDVLFDRTFEPIWSTAGASKLLDIREFPARELKHAKELHEKYPKSWASVVREVHALRLNGRDSEAEAMAKSALAKPQFYEFDLDSRLWLQNELSYLLVTLGRFEEANAVLEPLLKRKASEDNNLVSQFINYGSMLLDQGNNEKALLAANKATGYTSPFGAVGIQFVNACSLYRRGEKAKADAIFNEMLLDHEDTVGWVMETAICMERTDTAAKIAIEQLGNDKNKFLVLAYMQECRVNPLVPPLAAKRQLDMVKIGQRPDVQAALKPMGVVLMSPVPCGL